MVSGLVHIPVSEMNGLGIGPPPRISSVNGRVGVRHVEADPELLVESVVEVVLEDVFDLDGFAFAVDSNEVVSLGFTGVNGCLPAHLFHDDIVLVRDGEVSDRWRRSILADRVHLHFTARIVPPKVAPADSCAVLSERLVSGLVGVPIGIAEFLTISPFPHALGSFWLAEANPELLLSGVRWELLIENVHNLSVLVGAADRGKMVSS